ncbi:MAG: hypothetical protein WC223_12495 [Bacteroidales bacterium]
MEGTIDTYIKEKVRKLGFDKYTIKPEKLRVNNTLLELKAFNEFYVLFHCSDDTAQFKIKADNDIITQDDYVTAGVPYLLYDLRGNISIDTRIAGNDVTFLIYQVLMEKL